MEKAIHLIGEVLHHTWAVLGEMAPWVLGGFAVAGVLSLWLNARAVREHFCGGRFGAILKAVALGVPLPVCSCGVIPLGASLRKHGAGKGATAHDHPMNFGSPGVTGSACGNAACAAADLVIGQDVAL